MIVRRAISAAIVLLALAGTPAVAQNDPVHNSGTLTAQWDPRSVSGAGGLPIQVRLEYQIRGVAPGTEVPDLEDAFMNVEGWFGYDGFVSFPRATVVYGPDGSSYSTDGLDGVDDVFVTTISFAVDVHRADQAPRIMTFTFSDEYVMEDNEFGNFPLTLTSGSRYGGRNMSQREVFEAMSAGRMSFRNLRITDVAFRGIDGLIGQAQEQGERARLIEEGDAARTNGDLDGALEAYRQARRIAGGGDIDERIASTEAARDRAADTGGGGDAASGAASGRTPGGATGGTARSGGGGGTTRPRATTPTRRPSAPQSDYNWGQDHNEYLAESARIRSMGDSLTEAMDQTFDAIRTWQAAQARQRRWEAAASLETAGQSPEQMIAQVEQKRRELERLADERRAEHRREMEELRREAERALEEAETEEEAIASGIVGLGAIVGEVAGSISIENQRRRAEEELEQQLTEAFREIQRDITGDIDRSIDTAKQGKAQTLFPEQFAYFVEVIDYYGGYRRQVDSGFTIDDTDWIYPPGGRPREPRLGRRPRYTSRSITTLMSAKWEMLDDGEPYGDETRDSLVFLTGVGIEEFPRRPEPYYYRSLLTDDVVDRYLLSRQADELSREQRYRRQARADRDRLSRAFFDAIEAYRRPLIRRVWEIGLATELEHSSGDGAFLFALRRNTDSLDYLLRLQPRNERGRVAQSLMMLAASVGEADGVDVLVARGADPAARDVATGATPILAAASEGHLNVVSRLDRSHDVDPRAALDDAHQRRFQAARYHLARYLMGRAVARNRPELLGNAFRYEPDVVHTTYRDGTSYLGYAAAEDRRRFLEAAFAAGASPDATDPRGIAIVGVAIAGDADDRTIRLIVDAGASLAGTDAAGRTLLHWAAARPRPRLVSYLLDNGAPLLQTDDRGRVPLHYAVGGLNDRLFGTVLSATGTVDVPDGEGNTPIHLALADDRADRAETMLAMAREFDLQNGAGETYLHLAVAEAPGLVDRLLSENVAVDLPDSDGDTALHYAVEHQRGRETFLIAAAGADLTAQNDERVTPVHAAISVAHPSWPSLIGDGAVLDVPDREGNTPLHLMLARDWRSAAGMIRRHEPGVVAANQVGDTYLHQAARNGDRVTVETLIEQGADVAATNNAGNTALHEAAAAGSLETAMVLLEAGADPAARNEAGDAPWHLAAAEEHEETERFIRLYRRNGRYFSRALRRTVSQGGGNDE